MLGSHASSVPASCSSSFTWRSRLRPCARRDCALLVLPSRRRAELSWPVDGALLENAVINLIDNAITYSDAGRTVAVSAERTDAGLRIAVRDEGAGIAEEHLDRIFERFYRVDKARSRRLGGTGLGLSIVKHIATAHGGQVFVESELGVGSLFQILIPPV